MSKFMRGLLIGLGILLAIAVLVGIGFQVYGMVTHAGVARVLPMYRMMPRPFGYARGGFRGGWLPFGGLIGVVGVALLAVLVIAALMSPGSGRPPARVCARCGRGLETGWVACPHCGQPVDPMAASGQVTPEADPSLAVPPKRGRTRGGASA